jgi:hypothetical protein
MVHASKVDLVHVTGDEFRCPRCETVFIRPSDYESTAEDLTIMFVEGAEATRRKQEQQENGYYAKPRVHEAGPLTFVGGNKAGRKRKKPKKPGRPYEWDRTFGEV